MVGTDTQLIADLSSLELAREESWWVWLNPFVLYDVIDLHRLKLYVEIVILLECRIPSYSYFLFGNLL